MTPKNNKKYEKPKWKFVAKKGTNKGEYFQLKAF